MPTVFTQFVALVGSFVNGAYQLILYSLALGILCACPYLIRRIIDYV